MSETAEALLRGVGFTQHEAAVYVSLLRHPGATGYEIAKASGLPRANVYGVLEILSRRGVAHALSAEPARYAAAPPAQVLARTQRDVQERCQAALVELERLETPPTAELFFNLRGPDEVVGGLVEMVERARERAVLSLWTEDLPHLRPALLAAHARGAAVILNLFGETGNGAAAGSDGSADEGLVPAGAQVYWHEPADKTVGGHLVVAAVDASEALAGTLDAPASGVYTQNATLVRLVEKLVRDESYLAEIFAQLGPELEQRFGPHLVALRRRLLPRDQAERLLTVVAFGRSGLEVRGGRDASALLENARAEVRS